MNSFVARVYVLPGSTASVEQLPVAVWRTMLVTRLPAGRLTSYVKQRPDTCGKRPLAPGIAETPFSRNDLTSAPLTISVTDTFPNGSTPSTEPRVIGNGGVAALDGQNPAEPASG